MALRIEETVMLCNIYGEEFWTQLDIIKHLKEPTKGSKTVKQYFCKLCGTGLLEINAMHQHMINHAKNFVQEDLEVRQTRH